MNLLSIPINQMVDHHPWIHNRFMVKPKFHKIIIPKIIDILEQVCGCLISIESYDFDLNNSQPVLCLWLDCATNIQREAHITVKNVMAEFGFECGLWWEKEKNCTRISIWRVIPEYIATALRDLEHQWEMRSNKACTRLGAGCGSK